VDFKDGTKYLSLKSSVEIHNYCTFPLDVLIECANQPAFMLEGIPPEATRAVPIQFSCRGIMHFRPSSYLDNEDADNGFLFVSGRAGCLICCVLGDTVSYEWSDMSLSCSDLRASVNAFRCQPCYGKELAEDHDLFFCIQVDGGSSSSSSTRTTPGYTFLSLLFIYMYVVG